MSKRKRDRCEIIAIDLANSPLLASEQFSLGGYYSVRGYRERIVNGDNASCFNFELRTLPITVLCNKFPCMHRDALVLLAFFDIGHAWDNQNIPGFPQSQTLIGVGYGMRYHIGSTLSSRLDIGFPLRQVQDDREVCRAHFSLVMNY